MPTHLILNADDFGLTPGVNRAIAELYQAGVLTSATLMANGPAFDDAVAVAHANPSLGVGCHVVLTDGVPVSPPHTIPTLAPNGRTLRPRLQDFVLDLLLNRIRPDDIQREALAQIQKLQRAGIDVTHVDTHKHIHLFPAVARPLLALLERTSIAAIRCPFEPAHTRRLSQSPLSRRLLLAVFSHLQVRFEALPQIRNGNILTPSGTLGIAATGSLTPTTLRALLGALPSDGVVELCCHPGFNDADLDRIPTRLRSHRETELQALLICIPELMAQPNAPQLIHYGGLGAFGALREKRLVPP